MIAKGVFDPSFAAERCAAGDAPNQGDEKRKSMRREGRNAGEAKRRHTGGSQPVGLACGNSYLEYKKMGKET